MIVAELAAAAILLACSGLLATLGLRALRQRLRMLRWPRIEGRVLEHVILSRRRHHRPQFLVEYRVGGRRLKTLCDSPTRAGYTARIFAEKTLRKYPVDSQVLLYVDPNRSERAFLWLPELLIIAMELIGAILFAAAVVAGVRAT